MNILSGGIPDTVSTLPELEVLDLGSNRLNRSISPFLAEMKGSGSSTSKTTTSTAWCRSAPSLCSGSGCSRLPGTASCATTGPCCWPSSPSASRRAKSTGSRCCRRRPRRRAVRQVRVPGAAAAGHGAVGEERGLRRRAQGIFGRRDRHKGGPSAAVRGVAVGLSCLALF
jgi:hypothetical protein